MKVEIWSDVVCPWCYVGKREFEAALARFPHADQVTVEWRSFELDPTTPARVDLTMDQVLQRKYGMGPEAAEAANAGMTALAARLGLEYHLDQVRMGNTFDAHRLLHLAAAEGRAAELKECLLAAYFSEGRSVSDRDTLLELGTGVGLDSGQAIAVLDGTAFADEVRADEARAADLGVTGVPFFLVDGRLGVPGAQPAEVLLRVLEQAWDRARPAVD